LFTVLLRSCLMRLASRMALSISDRETFHSSVRSCVRTDRGMAISAYGLRGPRTASKASTGAVVSCGSYDQSRVTGGPDDTDGLSPRVTAYSRIWRWENDTLRFIVLRLNSSLRLAWEEEEEGLVLAERTLELLRQDFSWAGSVRRRRRGEAAAEAVKGELE